ncbi:MAG: patatin-like phospholipase family protein, partial [Muribaculaceae bacterium]|nr:patatin-like phospholipase family protein [Muribaculaceae bacterium]
MRRYLTLLILLLQLVTGRAASPGSINSVHQSVGLVLSGGGAKGIAHIGVIRALEDNNIPIDYIAGTSMGSIVGGLYACGYTTDEMLDLILSEGFSYWSTGTMDPRLSFYLNRARQTPAMLNIPISFGKSKSSSVPQSLISPLPMNFAFMELFSPITAQTKGDFNRLMVPYRCVASDVAARHKMVLSSGSIGDAIRASMSFPAVFQATEVNGALLYDGGIYDNFPVDVMRSVFAPSIMIGVDVSTEETGPQTSILDQLTNLI